MELSNLQTKKLDDIEIGVLLSNFAQQLRRKIADVPDVTLIDAAGIPQLWF